MAPNTPIALKPTRNCRLRRWDGCELYPVLKILSGSSRVLSAYVVGPLLKSSAGKSPLLCHQETPVRLSCRVKGMELLGLCLLDALGSIGDLLEGRSALWRHLDGLERVV